MRASKDNRGLTLIEVLMAMLVSFIVFLGLTETIVVAVRANVRNALRGEAMRVAEEEINEIRTTPFDNVFNGSALVPAEDNVSRTYRLMNKQYRVTRNVTDIDSSMKQVVVTVFWSRGNEIDNSSLTEHTAFTTILRKR